MITYGASHRSRKISKYVRSGFIAMPKVSLYRYNDSNISYVTFTATELRSDKCVPRAFSTHKY